MLKHLRIRGVNRNQRVDVACVTGLKLPLHAASGVSIYSAASAVCRPHSTVSRRM